jgi:Plasmid pRiA4b ORF-3-like protein
VPSGDDYPGEERLDERRFRLADDPYLRIRFGDSWAHEVVVEKTLSADPKKKCAVCLYGENACPPEALDPRIIGNVARVKHPITSIIRTFPDLAQYVRATPPGALRRKDSALVAICR